MRKTVLLLITLVFLTSCAAKMIDLALKKNGVLDDRATLQPLTFQTKEVLFLGMVHLARKEYYQDVTSKIDSLLRDGYFIFHEGQYLKRSDKMIAEIDMISLLKFRRITQIDPLIAYSATKPFSDYVSKYQLIDQPDYAVLGLTRKNSKPVDLPVTALIHEFEKAKGVVSLNECDHAIKLGDPTYSCGHLGQGKRKFFIDEIILHLRNENIVQNIRESDKEKILILYGRKHYKELKKQMEENHRTSPNIPK